MRVAATFAAVAAEVVAAVAAAAAIVPSERPVRGCVLSKLERSRGAGLGVGGGGGGGGGGGLGAGGCCGNVRGRPLLRGPSIAIVCLRRLLCPRWVHYWRPGTAASPATGCNPFPYYRINPPQVA
ncbi:hypothetical protein D7W82_12925 [Corallococcus sp. CA049B]|nr:hypothetical protein D7W82_12925 [Corallococcus sp. CA049B]